MASACGRDSVWRAVHTKSCVAGARNDLVAGLALGVLLALGTVKVSSSKLLALHVEALAIELEALSPG